MTMLRLSPSVLEWAASQAGSSVEDVARRVSTKDQGRIVTGGLTEAQVVKFSKITSVPLGFLFFSQPPAPRDMPIADFRTLPDSEPLGREFLEVYDDIVFKQSWYKNLLAEGAAKSLPFIGRFANSTESFEVIASDMRVVLGVDSTSVASLPSPNSLYTMLAAKAEAVGVLIFKNSVVGNNTSRPLSAKQFRGFVISDQYAPVVFINGADSQSAWAFTLAHELAHLWLGETGVSDVRIGTADSSEKRCNSIAAEFLLPREEFILYWKNLDGNVIERVEQCRVYFRVSALAIAYRAIDMGLADSKIYAFFAQRAGSVVKSEAAGGDFYSTLAVRNSKTFSRRVVRLAVSGQITLKEAGRLLNVNPNKIASFYARQN